MYKTTCFKCKVTVGPTDTQNVKWIICGECNKLLGGYEVKKGGC